MFVVVSFPLCVLLCRLVFHCAVYAISFVFSVLSIALAGFHRCLVSIVVAIALASFHCFVHGSSLAFMVVSMTLARRFIVLSMVLACFFHSVG